MKIKKATKKFLSKLNIPRHPQKVEIGDFIIEEDFDWSYSLTFTFKEDPEIQFSTSYFIPLDKIELWNLKNRLILFCIKSLETYIVITAFDLDSKQFLSVKTTKEYLLVGRKFCVDVKRSILYTIQRIKDNLLVGKKERETALIINAFDDKVIRLKEKILLRELKHSYFIDNFLITKKNKRLVHLDSGLSTSLEHLNIDDEFTSSYSSHMLDQNTYMCTFSKPHSEVKGLLFLEIDDTKINAYYETVQHSCWKPIRSFKNYIVVPSDNGEWTLYKYEKGGKFFKVDQGYYNRNIFVGPNKIYLRSGRVQEFHANIERVRTIYYHSCDIVKVQIGSKKYLCVDTPNDNLCFEVKLVQVYEDYDINNIFIKYKTKDGTFLIRYNSETNKISEVNIFEIKDLPCGIQFIIDEKSYTVRKLRFRTPINC